MLLPQKSLERNHLPSLLFFTRLSIKFISTLPMNECRRTAHGRQSRLHKPIYHFERPRRLHSPPIPLLMIFMDALSIWALSFDSRISLDLCSRIPKPKISHWIHKEGLDIEKNSHCLPPGKFKLKYKYPSSKNAIPDPMNLLWLFICIKLHSMAAPPTVEVWKILTLKRFLKLPPVMTSTSRDW